MSDLPSGRGGGPRPPFLLYDAARDGRVSRKGFTIALILMVLVVGGSAAAVWDQQNQKSQTTAVAGEVSGANPSGQQPHAEVITSSPSASPTASAMARPTPTPLATAWIPKGYDKWGLSWQDGGLAWKWTEEECRVDADYCWTMRVKSRDGCPHSLVGTVDIKRKAELLASKTDRVINVGKGRIVLLTFSYSNSQSGTLYGYAINLVCT
ncbi:MAG: hypothetical protein Q7K25_04675 [Actinomycetota bacterium]|nr:hypothetical protein [Actinomycetota bacterium]